MTDDEIDVEEVLYMNKEARVREYGDLGVKIDAQSKVYNQATGLLAWINQFDFDETYDPDGEIQNHIRLLCDRIEDDVEAKFEEEL